MKRKYLSLTLAAICVTTTLVSKTVSAKKFINMPANEDLVGANLVSNFDIPERFEYARTIIGEEDRTLVENTKLQGYSAIGYILVKFPNGTSTRGTAWMASENVAMTSAHCLYDSTRGGLAKSVTFVPGRNGSSYPFSTYSSTNFYVPEEYKVNSSETYDYAMIKFSTKIGRKTGYLNLKPLTEETSYYDFIVSGYPKNLDNDTSKVYYQQYEHYGSIFSYTDTKLYYCMDTSAGDSGAPIFYQDPKDGQNYAVGVHRGGNNSRNVGIRFTDDFINTTFKSFCK